MNDEQIAFLKHNNKPYSESLFRYAKRNFKKYLAILNLAAYRKMEWKDSDRIEEIYSKFKENKV